MCAVNSEVTRQQLIHPATKPNGLVELNLQQLSLRGKLSPVTAATLCGGGTKPTGMWSSVQHKEAGICKSNETARLDRRLLPPIHPMK